LLSLFESHVSEHFINVLYGLLLGSQPYLIVFDCDLGLEIDLLLLASLLPHALSESTAVVFGAAYLGLRFR
jgi:hypothetical protein